MTITQFFRAVNTPTHRILTDAIKVGANEHSLIDPVPLVGGSLAPVDQLCLLGIWAVSALILHLSVAVLTRVEGLSIVDQACVIIASESLILCRLPCFFISNSVIAVMTDPIVHGFQNIRILYSPWTISARRGRISQQFY